MILANTPAQAAYNLVQKIHHILQKAAIPHEKSRLANQITISSGIATLIPQDEQQQDLIKQADIALYQAKNNGRNQIVLFEETQ